jgi:hypothetical protein
MLTRKLCPMFYNSLLSLPSSCFELKSSEETRTSIQRMRHTSPSPPHSDWHIACDKDQQAELRLKFREIQNREIGKLSNCGEDKWMKTVGSPPLNEESSVLPARPPPSAYIRKRNKMHDIAQTQQSNIDEKTFAKHASCSSSFSTNVSIVNSSFQRALSRPPL